MANRTEHTEQNAAILTDLLASQEALLRHQAEKHSRNSADAEDARQRAYLLFIERYRPPYQPLAWLQTTIKREAWAISRCSARRAELSLNASVGDGPRSRELGEVLPALGPGPEEQAEERSRHEQLVTALEALKPDERAALILLGLGCSYLEISELRGWTHTKVNRCLAEGRSTVRNRVSRE